MIDPAAGPAPTVQGEAVSIGPAVAVDSVTWTARPRTGRAVNFRASVSRAFKAAASIAAAAAEDLVALIAPVVEDSAVVASAAAGLEVDDEN